MRKVQIGTLCVSADCGEQVVPVFVTHRRRLMSIAERRLKAALVLYKLGWKYLLGSAQWQPWMDAARWIVRGNRIGGIWAEWVTRNTFILLIRICWPTRNASWFGEVTEVCFGGPFFAFESLSANTFAVRRPDGSDTICKRGSLSRSCLREGRKL